MKQKFIFETPEFQRAHEAIQAHQSDPENIARWESMLKEERAAYWTSLPFFLTLLTTIPLIFFIWLVQQPGFEFVPLSFVPVVLFPVGAFHITWPRRRW